MKNLLYSFSSAFPPPLKKQIKEIVYSKEKLSRVVQDEEIQRLRTMSRYLPTETLLFGQKIKILDGPSFVSLKNEIIDNEIYKFHTENKEPFIIDAGANIGVSVIFFKNLYPNSKIVAFEPDPVVFDVLRHNIAAFGFTGVELIPKALWSSETTLNFSSEGADAGRIPEAAGGENLVTVLTDKLSNYVNERVDLLKIDIEGAEYEVLKECRHQLEKIDRIFIEYHSFLNQEQSLPEILAILKAAGFRLYLSTPGVFSPSPFNTIRSYLGMDLQVNIFGLKSIQQNSFIKRQP